MFHPDIRVSAAVAVVVARGARLVGIRRHRLIAPPKTAVAVPAQAPAAPEALAPLLAEARRDVGELRQTIQRGTKAICLASCCLGI